MDALIAFDNVSDIEIDLNGNVWMACNSGLYKYDEINTVPVIINSKNK